MVECSKCNTQMKMSIDSDMKDPLGGDGVGTF